MDGWGWDPLLGRRIGGTEANAFCVPCRPAGCIPVFPVREGAERLETQDPAGLWLPLYGSVGRTAALHITANLAAVPVIRFAQDQARKLAASARPTRPENRGRVRKLAGRYAKLAQSGPQPRNFAHKARRAICKMLDSITCSLTPISEP